MIEDQYFRTDQFGFSNYDCVVRWLRPQHPTASDANIDLWTRGYLRNNRGLVNDVVDGAHRARRASAFQRQIGRERLERDLDNMLRDRERR